MNKHLNIFKTYTEINRNYQLENDLTRALAICLQEDPLFCHEVLKTIIDDSSAYNQLFEDLDSQIEIQIEIQKRTSLIDDFGKVYAVSLSESLMSAFWEQDYNAEYDPICDMVITVNDVLIVIEAKRDNIDCTAQLYNQILNIFKHQEKNIVDYKEIIKPFDLNWRKLMPIAVKVASFEKATGNSNRFLIDFIQLVKGHNFAWLPETPIGSLKSVNPDSIYRRVESALVHYCDNDETVEKLVYNDRLGTTFSKGWANELLFEVDSKSGDLEVSIYPGNTKGQGYYIFDKAAEFSNRLTIDGENYITKKCYHIKMMGQSYITGLWLDESEFIKPLYTSESFYKYSGRVQRDNWSVIENLLDQHISSDWREQCRWQDRILDSNRTVFNIAFGYHISLVIPSQKLAQLDTKHSDITPLANFLQKIYQAFESDLIIESAQA